MNLDKKSMLLYAVTDRMWLNGRSLYDDVELALKGGVTLLQLREKNLPYEEFLAEAVEIKALCKKYNVPLIINDNVEIAIACNADGVHVGQHDMEASSVRERLGDDKIIGVSVQTAQQAVLAEKSGADYLGAGAVFNTSTKSDAICVTNDALKEICDAVQIPVCAIGGINEENIHQLSGSGINGVAVVSAVFAQQDITLATKNLYTLSKKLFA